MRHLSDAELVDAAERTLTPSRRAHLDSCDRCRAAMNALESMLREVSAGDVPEPSPLFWDHFSGRVHDAVAAEEPSASGSAWTPLRAPWIQIVAFCTIVIAVMSGVWLVRSSATVVPSATTASAGASQGSPAASPSVAYPDDAAWAELNAVAADVNVDEASSAGFTVRPAAVDSAVQRLTPQERDELKRLLQSEMKRSSD